MKVFFTKISYNIGVKEKKYYTRGKFTARLAQAHKCSGADGIHREEEQLMKHLWKLVNRFCPRNSETAIFLSANILLFTLIPMVCGVLFCMLTQHFPIMGYLSDMMLASIYTGIIFGLFGGILYLMGTPKK